MEKAVFFTNQDALEAWFKHNPNATEVWVGYLRKSTGRDSITWSESVDVALCIGWIDGIRKSIDNESYKIRFTPRTKASARIALNVKKVNELIALEKMTPAGLELFHNRSYDKGYTSANRNVPLSEEFEEIIKANGSAWLFLSNLASSYKRDSIWWVLSAKKEETRLKRLGILIDSSEVGLKIPRMRKKNELPKKAPRAHTVRLFLTCAVARYKRSMRLSTATMTMP